jgi:transcriptional regulator with XRE-family HTH domain
MSNSLREIRKARRLTLKQVAEKVGVSEGQASRIERTGTTSLETAIKYADVLGVPVELLVRKKAA